MMINQKSIAYLSAILAKIEKGEPIERKHDELFFMPLDFCSECDREIGSIWSPDHLMIKAADGSLIIAQCCEGYQPIAI